jgi:hypothetical protein
MAGSKCTIFTRVRSTVTSTSGVTGSVYSARKEYLGARADSALVKLFCHGVLVKTHPRLPCGQIS